ncbi:hypothetical protein ACFL3D_02390 [Candidatus Omnitrophota bacterium]
MIKNDRIKKWYLDQGDKTCNTIVRILDVEYAHIRLIDNSDLYVTSYGLPFLKHLYPDQYFTDKEWFRANAIRLSGTSCVYKVTSKEVDGKSKDLVIKWNRMGQDIPGATAGEDLDNARFNSPFEEFSLVKELRLTMYELSVIPHIVQKPLAIYVPAEKSELDRMGRREYEMKKIVAEHTEIAIDMNRSYAVIYEWIKGFDAAEACKKGIIDESVMQTLTIKANDNMREMGYFVRDNKPQHIIVRKNNDTSNRLLKRDDRYLNAIVDFELLERTKEQAEMITKSKRKEYHRRQTERFTYDSTHDFHPHLHHVNLFGVDYIYGQVESTKGRLWVVGSDPYLFDFFLPERWEKEERTKISMFSESYATQTKDNINIIWEVSKVGLQPDCDPFKEDEKRLLQHGYNSPFEEVALAIELSAKNIPTIYPRAVYMAGFKTEIDKSFFDQSRYDEHGKIRTPDKMPLLMKDHEYIIIWGNWNGPDELLAHDDKPCYAGVNALRAYRNGYITQEQYMKVLFHIKDRLRSVGVEDINLKGAHLLLSLNEDDKIVMADNGLPEVRICNFEFLEKL